ncbi:unnamed protein product, partial [Bubo scandiacus]
SPIGTLKPLLHMPTVPCRSSGGSQHCHPPHTPQLPHTLCPCCPPPSPAGFLGGVPPMPHPCPCTPKLLRTPGKGGPSQCPPQPLPSDWGACCHP